MVAKDMNKAALAQKIGASPAYVSKVMRGDANFTLETMTKLAMAVGGKVQARIVDADAHVLRPDAGAAAWTLCANSRPRATRSATIVVGLPPDLAAANDWQFMSANQPMGTIDSDEMRVA
jgi:transcriptional regulator with XRE-family HTH domain